MHLQNIFLFITIAFTVGDCLGLLFTHSELAYALLAALALFAVAKFMNKHINTIVLVCLFLFLALGMFLGYENRVALVEQAMQPFWDKQVQITGYIQDTPAVQTERSVRLRLNLQKLEQHSYPDYKINLYFPKDATIPPVGSLISFNTQLQAIQSFNNPSNFDQQQKSYLNNLVGNVYLHKTEWQVLAIPEQKPIKNILQDVVDSYQSKLLEIMPAQHAGLIKALVLGGSSDIPASIWQDFSLTGLIHVLCISGLHTTLMAMLIMSICKLLLRNEKAAAILSIVFVVIYICMTNLSLPVVRAGIMSILILAGYLLGRAGHTAAIFTFTLLSMIVYKPNIVLELSFQLTFLATGSLIFVAPKLYAWLSKYISMKACCLSLAAVLSVQIVLLPILVNNFHQFSLIAFVSNLLLVPVVEIIILLIVIGSIFLFTIPAIGKIILVSSSIFLDGTVLINSALAALPMSNIIVAHLPVGIIFTYYTLLYLAIFPPTALQNIDYYQKLSAALFALTVMVLLFIQPQRTVGPQIHFIDVGQGDAALLISQNNKAILIDTGGINPTFDIATRVVNPYLRYYGIKEIELLLLTHEHFDHAGGSLGLSKDFPVVNVLAPEDLLTKMPHDLKRNLRNSKLIKAELGSLKIDEWQLDIINIPRTSNPNDCIVVKASTKGFAAIFTGDIDNSIETQLVPQLDKVDILKVAHHGSAQSSSEDFLQLTRPDIAVISVGRNNRYNHPTPQALERLNMYTDNIFRTDKHGAIVISFAHDKIFINTNKKAFR